MASVSTVDEYPRRNSARASRTAVRRGAAAPIVSIVALNPALLPPERWDAATGAAMQSTTLFTLVFIPAFLGFVRHFPVAVGNGFCSGGALFNGEA
jgi:hypothetical protein